MIHNQTARTSRARRPALQREKAMQLAATEYSRLLELLQELADDEWRLVTECPPWDVRAMAGHCVGMARFATGFLERHVRTSRPAAAPGATSVR